MTTDSFANPADGRAGPRGPEHQVWEERLQDWLDGELQEQDTLLLQAHLEQCAQCREQLQAWQRLDAQLQAALPPLRLDAAFDARLFAQIDSSDEQQRLQLRQQLEREHELQREALMRRWRRSLALVIPGMLGGVAVALSLASWMDSSGATIALAQGAAELSHTSAPWTGSALTAALGAAVGALMAPWLARLAD